MGIHRISLGSVELGNPVRSELAGFRFLLLFIVALQPHAAQSFGLLLLAIEFVTQPTVGRSRDNTDDFLGGLTVGIHFFSPEMIDLIIGFGTT
jgi:hypothetical protein